jgi:hypothetical protein
MNRTAMLLGAAMALMAPAPAGGDIINVPGDAPGIQAAIDMAADGDRILVSAGTYSETINLLGKAVHLVSAGGEGMTIIDAGGARQPVVACVSGEGRGTVIEGFTITGGAAGGMLIVDGSPTIVDCSLVSNSAMVGAGVRVDGGSPLVSQCHIAGNLAGDGGGMASRAGAAPMVVDCTFLANHAGSLCFEPHPFPGCGDVECEAAVCAVDPFCCDIQWDQICVGEAQRLCRVIVAAGGGVLAQGSAATFLGCTFELNSAHAIDPSIGDYDAGVGGGLHQESGSSVLIGCVFEGNDAGAAGGAAWSDGSTAHVVGCTFVNNEALGGGGAFSFASTLHLINSLFEENFAVFGTGGGLIVSGGSATVTNCTFALNQAAFGGGAIDTHGDTLVRNSILWANVKDQVAGAGATVLFSCVQGGHPGAGNIDEDPLFVAPFSGEFALQSGSPCVDGAHNWAVPLDAFDLDGDGETAELLPLDLAGMGRFAGTNVVGGAIGCGVPVIVDMGAYETAGHRVGPVLYGDVDGSGAVDVDDLVAVVLEWGGCGGPRCACCLADLNLDGAVGIEDLVAVIVHWSG